MNIIDQTTDTSLSFIVKIAAKLNDGNLANTVLHIAQTHKTPLTKTATALPAHNRFPLCSKEDVVLSRVYFNGQREKIASDIAETIDNEISKFEALYGINEDWSFKPMNKTASIKEYELLPGYSVSSKNLNKAEKEFNTKYAQLSIEDRNTFSNNFLKAAEECVYFPEDETLMDVYSGNRECDASILNEQLNFRKIAMERIGGDGSAYEDLATQLEKINMDASSKEEKIALAEYIGSLDKTAGLDDPKYDRMLPDAWRIVFNKTAEVADTEDTGDNKQKATSMSKADVVARFGDGALDAVEDFNGKIDTNKLETVIKHFGNKNGK